MGGSSKGGGGGHTPIEQPNTLESAQRLKIIDLLCEGIAGQDVSFKNIYLDNTPIQNADGSYNFTGIRASALPGTHNQDYLAGFDSTDKIVPVGAEVKAATPITRTITDPLVDSVRVTLALGSLVEMKDNGDRVGGSVSLTVKCGDKSYPVTISGKTTSAYHQDVVLTDLPEAPFNISVHRNTPDSTSDSTSNATHWVSYVESIDAKFSYPNSVVVGLEIDSAQFGGKIPKRTYLNKWTQIKVPNNYDPINRTYDGIWLGEFKTAWSDNPAWVFYDLVTDKRYGLGDRLGDFGCDKWSLYQIAKYCDQIVPDGFGGVEPRFTCNAYLSEPRDAKALLDDLASVFRGIAVWDGQMVTALQDAKKDPTATYSNSNVVDGVFAYSGAAQKTIFTAAHIKYNDKTDNYGTKTEYVANDEAIKRYGLNVKQITAFGCTSRGQAARVGKWLIETSIRERQMVSFKVGREGIRHLPFDIIEIADNDYAGDMIGGRVLSVVGNTITVDRAMSDIRSIRYYADGQSKTVSVQSTDGAEITLADTPKGIEQLGVFSASKTDVKPRLFRALSIKEDDGTYTISAVQHDENKEAVVDQGVTFEQDNSATKHKPQVSYGRVSKDGDELVISWEGTNTTQYLIKIYKDSKLYRSYTQDSAEIKLKGLSNGEYRAEIRGKSASGELTEAVIKEWSIDYDIKGLKATPELFAIKLDWTNPTTVINKAKIEIYRSLSNDRASSTKIATLSYPTDTFTQNGVKLSETHHFWLRLTDDQGNTGDWVTVSGQCSSDTSQIVASINGQITETELAQSLIDSLQNDVDAAKDEAISAAKADAAKKVLSEAKVRAAEIQAEADQRTKAIKAESDKQTKALTDKAQELGTQISEVSDANDEQARQLTTLTAKQGDLTSGLETERKARIDGDKAEASARKTLVGKVENVEGSITSLKSTKASKTEVVSLARTALQSEWKDYADDKVDNLEIGGRNLLLSSKFASIEESESTWRYCVFDLTKELVVGENYVFSAKIEVKKGDIHSISVYDYPNGEILTVELDNGKAFINFVATSSDPTRLLVYAGIAGETAGNAIDVIEAKLERGNKATDWTPAPEDVDAAINTVSSELTSFKQTQASKDQAQTVVNNQALSRINNAEGKITTLQTTKANKDEVSSLVRTALQSEWQDSANTAKTQAINAAKADAKAKADAAEAAAKAHADAQVDAKSVSDKAYADGLITAEEQRAIADANAKLDIAKRDAANKAALARQSAETYARVQVGNLKIGGRNLLLDSKFLAVEASDAGTYNYRTFYLTTQLIVGQAYTFKATIETASDVETITVLFHKGGQRYDLRIIDSTIQITFTAASAEPNRLLVYSGIAGKTAGNAIDIIEAKLEKGNKATDWTPAPEDVDAAINTVSSELTEFKQTTASKDQAQTIVNNQALSRINNAEGKITTLQKTSVTKDKAQSAHTIKTQAIAGGKRAIAGIAIGAMADEETAESEVIVMADKFGVVKDADDGTVKPMFSLVNNQAAFNGDLIADGTILGKHIKANQTLSAPIINGGSLNINNRFKVDKYGNMTAKSGRFEGAVLANKIEGAVANIKAAAVGTLQIAGEAVIVPRVQFTASTFRFYTIDTEEVINSITLDAQGGAVSICFGFERLYARAGGNNNGYDGKVYIRIKRDNHVLRTLTFEVNSSVVWYTRGLADERETVYQGAISERFITLPTILDTPLRGQHTYSVTLESRGLNAGKSADDRATYPVEIDARSLHVMGVKR